MHWNPETPHRRRPGFEARFDKLCGAQQFDHADADAPIYAPNEWFFKEGREHAYAMALHMMYYNFVRLHSKLRMSPAMAAGVTAKLWEIGDIVALVEAADPKPGPHGPYKKGELCT